MRQGMTRHGGVGEPGVFGPLKVIGSGCSIECEEKRCAKG